VRVRIPTPLRSYTEQVAVVDASGDTVGDVLDALDRRFPGLRFRVIDEQGRIRKHMRIFVNDEMVKTLHAAVSSDDEVTLLQALSGG
jgi:molybdopterin converting factor small subunit